MDFDKFVQDVQVETERARNNFKNSGWHPEQDNHSWADWICVAGEEFGKITRCACKLMIASDDQVVAEWKREMYRRIVTTSSVLTRMMEAKGIEPEEVK